MRLLKDYIKLARPKHWIKNILIFTPSLFGGTVFQRDTLIALFIGVISFCFISSSIYFINDIKDKEKDCHHEVKKHRPVASGRVSVRNAAIVAFVLSILAFSVIIFYFSGSVCVQAASVLAAYFIINILYSSGLKDRPIIDVMLLAAGFVLRVVFGSIICGVDISQWLLLTILMFSLYMGLGKRRNELRKITDGTTRKVLNYYSNEYLSRIMQLSVSLGLVFYSLWAAVVVKQGNIMVWTVPLVIAIIMKYELDIEKDTFGDPVEILTHDISIFLMLIAYAVIVVYTLYIY